MLLQTVKSRNLWLWGEIVQPTSTLRYRDQLLAEQENLENEKSILSDNLVYLNKQKKNTHLESYSRCVFVKSNA